MSRPASGARRAEVRCVLRWLGAATAALVLVPVVWTGWLLWQMRSQEVRVLELSRQKPSRGTVLRRLAEWGLSATPEEGGSAGEDTIYGGRSYTVPLPFPHLVNVNAELVFRGDSLVRARVWRSETWL